MVITLWKREGHLRKGLICVGIATNTNSILVVGAAHIDVWADYWSRNADKLDKIGEVKFAVGGTGYNIAVDLAQAYIRTSLFSVVKKGRFSAVWITTRLKEAGVGLDFLQTSDRAPESGFVATRRDQELEVAVTSTGIASTPLSRELLEKAVENCCLVVADCNLSEDQLVLVVEAANRHERPILIAAVSDSKARRILELDERCKIDVFSLNDKELLTIEEKPVDDLTCEDVSRICRLVRSRHVLVTRGSEGYVVMVDTGQKLEFDAPTVEHFVSSSGAGDALLAGVAAHWYEERTFNWSKAHIVIGRFVRKVLEEAGSTQGSLASEVDFAILAETAVQETRRSLYNQIMQSHLVPWFTIISGIVAVVALLLTL